MNRMLLAGLLAILLSSCTSGGSVPTLTPQLPATSTSFLPVEPTTIPPTVSIPTPQPKVLYEQNFEVNSRIDLEGFPNFQVNGDDKGNHFICNGDSPDYQNIYFGNNSWADYAVELRVKALAYQYDPYVNVNARLNNSGHATYYGSMNFQTGIQGLALSNPYQNFGDKYIPTEINRWYTLRLEVLHDQLSYFIDERLIADGIDKQQSHGRAGFMASPHIQVCIDDIRVWALTETGLVEQEPGTAQMSPEIVTDLADPGNAWGGHQARIVHTKDGVFTTYITTGSDQFYLIWHLVWRRDANDWQVLAEGDAGDGPVNLLASPDGTLHIIGWPEGVGTIWSGMPSSGTIDLTKTRIPGVYYGFWSYFASGIDTAGNICVVTSTGGQTPGGSFMWACQQASTQEWFSHTTLLDYKYAYTYVFPQADGKLSIVSTRDVRWSALEYTQPTDSFDYVFNAIGFWQTNDFSKNLPVRTYGIEEAPTSQFPFVFLDAQQDAYLDTFGRMHIIYWLQGPSTDGQRISRHLLLSPTGKVLYDVELPKKEAGEYSRIFQDSEGMFYILSSSGSLYTAGKDGLVNGEPAQLDWGDYIVEYSGFAIAVPRTGTVPGNTMDVTFPSDGGRKWIYFQLTLPGN